MCGVVDRRCVRRGVVPRAERRGRDAPGVDWGWTVRKMLPVMVPMEVTVRVLTVRMLPLTTELPVRVPNTKIVKG